MSGRTVGSTRNPLQTLRGFVQGVESVYIVRGGDSREGGLKVNISGARALVPARRHFGPALSLPTFLLFISAALITMVPKDSDLLFKFKRKPSMGRHFLS